MINLHTGLPGAGKTLFTLSHLKPLAEKEARQVYYFGIPELQIPDWIELSEDQALKWFDLPAGSIIVIDEAQRLFRPRGAASKVPDHVARLETHRHGGHDLYLITQHPGLIDANVRKLVGYHRHVVRSFGAKFSIVHKWMQCKDSCDKNRKDSIKEQFRYPKEAFGWYKSAEVHTHKSFIPKKLLFLFAMPIIIGAAGWYAYQGLTVGSVEKAKAAVAKAQGIQAEHLGASPGTPADSGAPSMPGGSVKAGPMTAQAYMASLEPRIANFPHTAPRYDAVTEPVRAPYPAACLQMGSTCRCYSEQATRLAVDEATCRMIVERGFFMDWEPGDKPSGGSDRRSIATGANAGQRAAASDRQMVAAVDPMERAGHGAAGYRK